MLQLHARTDARWNENPLVLRISSDLGRSIEDRGKEAFLINGPHNDLPTGFRAYLALAGSAPEGVSGFGRTCILPATMHYLADGDIVRISPTTGHVSVLYRRASNSNSMLLTERCNSNCIMCSQPPKDADDAYLVDTYLEAVPLMDPDTPELGITGGEPTLLGRRLLDLIAACKGYLSNTALHLLSNGRMFNYLALCQDLEAIQHPDLVIGIPLYSDIASRHDFVVQARGAFDQTVRGIMNLERCGQRVEVRVVIHRETIHRLPKLAEFIARNLPFVEHVALMGLEMMGYVRMNLSALWIDPADYQQQLIEAVKVLVRHRMTVSIYNHQLCTLDARLWRFARKSISDWKNEYLDICRDCAVRDRCGGFFSSATVRRSNYIQPVRSEEFNETNCAPALEPLQV